MTDLTFDRFIEEAWLRFVSGLDREIRDDLHGLARLKTAYWAGANIYREALVAIQGAPVGRIHKRAMIARLGKGLDEFGAQLQPIATRRLDS